MSIVCTTPGAEGKTYLAGKQYSQNIPDEFDLKNRLEKLCQETNLTTPSEPLPNYGVLGFRVQPYGLLKWSDLFTSRQLLALMTFVKWVRLAHEEMMQQGYEEEFGKAIATYLGILLSKISDINNSLCAYEPVAQCARHLFGRQAIPMVWDFGENIPIGKSSGSWKEHLIRVLDSINITFLDQFANTQRGSAMAVPFESESIDAVVTDPPYFDSVPYADLSDFFYVWLKRSIGYLYPEHFSGQLTPKKNEAIMEPSRHGGDKAKAAKAYEDMMHKAFCESSRVLKLGGVMVVVYAHKTTSGWVTLIDSLRRAGFTIIA
jgi:putative DNA methylase